jgi:UTP:GlnB (protein PII) uridylyltransferase
VDYSLDLISMFALHLLNSVQSAQVLTKNNRVVDVFIVSDAEKKTTIPEDRWPDIKEKIFSKLKRRNVLNTATGDPKLAELVS